MMYILSFVAGSFVTLVLLAVYSCMVVAGRADREMEAMHSKRISELNLNQD